MTEIKIPIIPDMTKFDNELKKPRKANIIPSSPGKKGSLIGLGNLTKITKKNSTEQLKVAKKESMFSGKSLMKMSGIGLILSAFVGFVKPVFSILQALGGLLFMILSPILIPAFKGLIYLVKLFAKWAPEIKKIMQKVVGADSKTIIIPAFNYLRDIAKYIIEAVFKIGEALGYVSAIILYGVFEIGRILGMAGSYIWFEILKPAFMFLGDVGKWIWNQIIEPGFSFLLNIGESLFREIVNDFNDLRIIGKFLLRLVVGYFKYLKNVGSWIWNQIIKPAFSYLNNVGKWIWDIISGPFRWLANAISSAIGWFSSLGGSSKNKNVSVSDAIIQPNGRIIHTDRLDTIIATKTPENLSNGAKTYSPIININASISSDIDIREMAEKIAEYSQEELSRRTGDFRT